MDELRGRGGEEWGTGGSESSEVLFGSSEKSLTWFFRFAYIQCAFPWADDTYCRREKRRLVVEVRQIPRVHD